MIVNDFWRLFDVKNAFCDSMKTLLLSKRNRYFQGLGFVNYIKKLSLKLKNSSRTPNLLWTRSSAGLGILFSLRTPSKRRLGPPERCRDVTKTPRNPSQTRLMRFKARPKPPKTPKDAPTHLQERPRCLLTAPGPSQDVPKTLYKAIFGSFGKGFTFQFNKDRQNWPPQF